MSKRDYYEVLGVDRAYRAQMSQAYDAVPVVQVVVNALHADGLRRIPVEGIKNEAAGRQADLSIVDQIHGDNFAEQRLCSQHNLVLIDKSILEDFRQPAPEPLLYLPMMGPGGQGWGVGTPAYVVKSRNADRLAPTVRELATDVGELAHRHGRAVDAAHAHDGSGAR